MMEIHLGDVVRLRKPHPCGGHDWEVVRLGADIGLVCQGCRRRVLMPRAMLERKVKEWIRRAQLGDSIVDSVSSQGLQ